MQPKYICELFKRYNPYRNTSFRFFHLIVLFLSLLNLTAQNTRFSGCFIDMYFGSGRFDCYMTSQIEKRGDSVVALTFFRSLKPFRLTFLRMRVSRG